MLTAQPTRPPQAAADTAPLRDSTLNLVPDAAGDVIVRQRVADEGRTQLGPEVLRRRWDLVLAHREALLVIARRRVNSVEDAEDVVTTALLRTVEHANLDESRIGAFLCTTVKRLAVDVHRDRARQLAVGTREATRQLPAAPVDETVCDEAEARWLAGQLARCPERERQVLQARLSGLTAQQISAELGLTAKAAENAYTRLRQRAQAALATTLAGLGILLGLGRRAAKPGAAMVPVAAVAIAGLAIIAPSMSLPEQPLQRPALVTEAQSTRLDAPQSARSSALPVPLEAQQEPPAMSAAAPAKPALPAPEPPRTVVKPPTVVDPALADPGVVYVEERHDESFRESVERCAEGLEKITLSNPTADPCR